MSKTIEQLKSLKPGKIGHIRGQEVKRSGDNYVVDGDELPLHEAAKRLDQIGSPKSGVDYDWTVFLECPPGMGPAPIRNHRCRNKLEHTELLEAVKKRKNYLWYGSVVKIDGKFTANPPFIVDWDSIPDQPEEVKKPDGSKATKKWDRGLSCPFCTAVVSSTPGRTLHVKSAHPDRLPEYQRLLAAPDVDDQDDVVARQAEVQQNGVLHCPFCGVKIGSTSGRTLHVQGKHPERLQEYQKLLVGGKL